MAYDYEFEMDKKVRDHQRELKKQEEAKKEEERQKKLHEESILWGVLGKKGVLTLQNIASSLEVISNSLQNIEASFNTSYEE